MHRFYCQHADFSHSTIAITDVNEVHHIKDVLRLKAGDGLCIFNGRNQEAKSLISVVKEREIQVRVQSVREAVKGAIKIILACAVPKKAKFEFIIEMYRAWCG
jgi:16S rRNA (uracil1498-N3)-methyltransferase